MSNNLYPTPEKFHQLVKGVFKSESYKKEPVTEYQQFFNELPKRDQVDEFIHYLFSCLLGEPDHRCRFITMTEYDETCAAWIECGSYPIKVTDEAIKKLRESGWDKNVFGGEIKHPIEDKGEVKEKIIFGGIERLIGEVACERQQ